MKKNLLILAFISFSFISNGQKILRSVTSSAGANAVSGSTRLSYTVGESLISYINSNGSPTYKLSEGFQQSDSIMGTGGIKNLASTFISSSFKLSPNPANQLVKINYDLEKMGLISYSIYNSFGQLCLSINEEFCQKGRNENSIDLSNLAAGSYFINVSYNCSNDLYIKTLPLIIVK